MWTAITLTVITSCRSHWLKDARVFFCISARTFCVRYLIILFSFNPDSSTMPDQEVEWETALVPIKNWLSKQPHLPNDVGKGILTTLASQSQSQIFLYSNRRIDGTFDAYIT
ncbi:jg14711 [Pararge aegeria aegeria]|uniref:Jg14711 protein n=1 Tax=Pararge aegeria aegeria TaxID=348720 RepID=A0A8S4SEY9_9NEOP|nr:jg14711 [Pararge aegeria aegeria]